MNNYGSILRSVLINHYVWGYLAIVLLTISCKEEVPSLNISIQPNDHISIIGGNLCSRMMEYGYFETHIHQQFPNYKLTIRNMCDPGDTPGFRPHSGRFSPWAFPGAETFQGELANFSYSQGHFETPDQWLTRLETDMILAFFGYSESFDGSERVDTFKAELDAFITHTLNQEYNGQNAPTLVLISPMAFEDLSDHYDLPDGAILNQNLKLYSLAIEEVAMKRDIAFVDMFDVTQRWFKGDDHLTIDGFQLNDAGYQRFSSYLTQRLFKPIDPPNPYIEKIHAAVMDKNWYWHDDYKSPNGVHVFGRRYNPFGPDNYPDEIKKKRELTAIRDTAIWMAATGLPVDIAAKDSLTHPLSPVETNYVTGDYGRGTAEYLYGDDALATFDLPDGYAIELFASEKEFPDLANPVQISFDNKGRLWVAVMPTYPHYKPGDPKPNDKLLILEDTNHDGQADKQTVFADYLHLPIGFELAPEGVYISQGPNLKLFTDTDGDDQADRIEIILSGFDDHDTHHAISAFCADPSGAIYMGEGVFLHTNVETAYGPVRATNGGFYRYNPNRKHLERVSQVPIPNPWGIAFDDYGQNLFAETSGPDIRWMLPGEVAPRYGQSNDQAPSLVKEEDKVRPTSGLEFLSSRHFPDELQGDLLINNTIGFLGMRQHQVLDDSSGFALEMRQDIVSGSDPNFRPVDMEIAPDGSLYLADWHNVLIGHMQHNARDPLRDHVHGRIYRITYPERFLVRPAFISGAPLDTLFHNLTLPEYRTRYRTRRELRGRKAKEVYNHLDQWIQLLDSDDPKYEHHLLEGLWVSWGINKLHRGLLNQLIKTSDYRVRAAAIRVIRYMGHQLDDQEELLLYMADDVEGRVRLEVLIAASWQSKEAGLKIIDKVARQPMDQWLRTPYERAISHLNNRNKPVIVKEIITHLEGDERELFIQGKELYERESYCSTCHQQHGQGIAAAGYPPLRQSKWVTEDTDRLIKLTLKGLYGPMTVLNRQYDGKVPMTGFEGLMTDEEVAAVLTYIRNTFENKESAIYPEQVAAIRKEIADKKGFYAPKELLIQHPMEKDKEGTLDNLVPNLK